jgi:mono/diheme cytochrome c family protein
MNRDHDYGGTRENQLAALERLGLLRVNWAEPARNRLRDALKAKGLTEKQVNEEMAKRATAPDQRQPITSSLLPCAPVGCGKLVDPADKTADLTLRARSYLHSNCAQCHVEAGGGNAQMELEFNTPLAKMKVVDARPQHDAFGLVDARLVAPGHPEKSVLLHRLTNRGPGHMPPLATRHVDAQAVELIREWIRSMPTEGMRARE